MQKQAFQSMVPVATVIMILGSLFGSAFTVQSFGETVESLAADKIEEIAKTEPGYEQVAGDSEYTFCQDFEKLEGEPIVIEDDQSEYIDATTSPPEQENVIANSMNLNSGNFAKDLFMGMLNQQLGESK